MEAAIAPGAAGAPDDAATSKADEVRPSHAVGGGGDAGAEDGASTASESGEIDPNVMNVLAARLRFAEKMLIGRKKQKVAKLKEIAADKIALARVDEEIVKCKKSIREFADGLPEKEQTRLAIIKQMKDFETEISGICKHTRRVAKKALWQAAQQNKKLVVLQNETQRGFSMRPADQPYNQPGWGSQSWAEGGGRSPRRPMAEKNKFANPSPRSTPSRGSRGSRNYTTSVEKPLGSPAN